MHVPGPWWRTSGRGVDDSNGNLLALVNLALPLDTARDTASVIAAAPELLRLLKEARGTIRNLQLAGGPDETRDNFLADIDAAIAKAEGETA